MGLSPERLRLNNPFLALRHPNFRYFWIGMCISTIGTWMQNIAQPWLAYSLTGSPFLLSVIGALQFTPVLLLSLFAGVLIDRMPKRRILIVTQSASVLITLSLFLLAGTGQIRYWHIAVMATLLGVVNAFDMPARQSFVIELVGREDLMNAIALNSTAFNVSRLLGPALAGLVMSKWGVSACFLVNSVSFCAVLISLFFIRTVAPPQAPDRSKRIFAEIGEGLRYIKGHETLFVTLLIMAVVGTFAPNFSVTVPVFSTHILHQDGAGYGYLMSIMGLGSLLGALFIATISRSGPKRFILYIVPLAVGAGLALVGCTNLYILTGLLLAVTGFFFVSFNSNANSTMQLGTDNEHRGRVMSAFTLVNAGSTPIGNLFVGAMDNAFGPRAGFIASGAAILLLMAPIYLYLAGKEGMRLRG